MSRADNLLGALKRADAIATGGGPDAAQAQKDARALASLLREARAEEKEAENTTGLSAEDQELFGSTTASPVFGDGKMNQFVTGMGRGTQNIVEGAKDLYMRTQGLNAVGGRTKDQEDALDGFNRRADEDRALYERGFGDSGWATAGEITGEVLPSVVGGLGINAAVKGTRMAARTGLTAMAEGGATEFVIRRGDLGDRAKAAGIGAVTAGIADKAIGGLVNRAGRNRVDREVTELENANRVDIEDGANPMGLTAEGQRRKAMAERDGGFKLDAADAERHDIALREREALQTAGSPEYLKLRAQQQSDVTARANEFNPDGYKYDIETPNAGKDGVEQGSVDFVETLRKMRTGAKTQVDAAYNAWRKSHGSNTMIDTDGFRAIINAEMKSIRQGQKGLKKDLEEIMEKRGIRINVDGKSSMTDRIGSMDGDFINTMPKGQKSQPISIDTVEEIIQDINSLYKAGDGPSNRVAGQIKTRLDDWAVDSFGDISNLPPTHPVRLGKEARELARDTYKMWDDKTLIGKLTKLGVNGESLVTTPLASINSILKKGNSEKVRELKEVMQGNPQLKAAWDGIVNSKRMELMAAALKANSKEFSHKAYAAKFYDLDANMRKALWGNEALDMDKSLRAWSLRNVKPDAAARLNNSGTAESISGAQQVGALAVAGKFGIPLQMIAPVIRFIKGQSKNAELEKAARALSNGSLPPRSVAEAREELRKEIGERLDMLDANPDLIDTVIDELGKAARVGARATARVSLTPDGQEDAEARASKLRAERVAR
jgi:hypothetical protein